MTMLWAKIIDFFVGGFASKLLEGWKAKLASDNETDKLAVDLAVKDMDTRRAIVTAELGSWFTALPRVLIEFSYGLYITKILVIDKILGIGTTDPLTGDIGQWATVVLGGMFGASIASRIAGAIIKR